MEDILASIRRIIADDHSRTVAAASNAYRRTATQNVTPSASPLPPASAEPDGNAAPAAGPGAGGDLVDIVPPEPPSVPPPSRSSFSAAFEATSAKGMPHLNPPAMPSTAEADLSVIVDIVNAGAAAAILDPHAPRAEDAPVQKTAGRAAEPEPAEDSAVLSLHGFEAEPEQEQVQPQAVEAPPPVTAEPLLSASVGASVESSFQALATSVLLQNAGAVDAVTRDLLRPMLKSWLDDNLPAIVERLVRIEIERVARGVRS